MAIANICSNNTIEWEIVFTLFGKNKEEEEEIIIYRFIFFYFQCTDLISFSIWTARITIGPRTAYSTSITRGFKFSNVRNLLVVIVIQIENEINESNEDSWLSNRTICYLISRYLTNNLIRVSSDTCIERVYIRRIVFHQYWLSDRDEKKNEGEFFVICTFSCFSISPARITIGP